MTDFLKRFFNVLKREKAGFCVISGLAALSLLLWAPSFAQKDFKNSDRNTRLEAVKKSGETGAPGALKFLKEAANDEDPYVRGQAVKIIGALKSNESPAILSAALKSGDANTRYGAVEGLEALGGIKAVGLLIGLLEHKDRNTRWKAVVALGNLKNDRAVEPLLKTARGEKDEYVKTAAVESLGKIGTKKARAALNVLKTDKDGKLSKWAENVLKAAK
ncbi:MAG: HEAT repeat domain-containing protein [Elusimicrobia bacterium]|nr:HEAT repeat domain-containing protein [Elusimicrobiota bacterium]